MSPTPISPRLIKGAIIGIDVTNPVASITIFQYNPDTLTRTLQAQASGGESNSRSEPQRLKGPPTENIRLDVEIDATDQLETGGIASAVGIYPQLAALEMLLYPKMLTVLANTALLAAGTIEVVPVEGPFTLFIWGPQRVVPIRLTEFSITEEAHDTLLNPIRAKVSLGMRIQNYNDFPLSHPGFAMFMVHQGIKEAMAVMGSVGNAASFSFNLSI
ncbi:MAG: hypothetical protein JEZ00_05290 [Anaerolineaceae bacterium]|nr:hypothetical protein [Anaerolineaceae bacterium]